MFSSIDTFDVTLSHLPTKANGIRLFDLMMREILKMICCGHVCTPVFFEGIYTSTGQAGERQEELKKKLQASQEMVEKVRRFEIAMFEKKMVADRKGFKGSFIKVYHAQPDGNTKKRKKIMKIFEKWCNHVH